MNRPSALSLTLLGLLVAMCLVIGVVVTIGLLVGTDGLHGIPHDKFSRTMLQGGSGSERHASVRWLGLSLGLLQVSFFVGCLLLGIRGLAGRTRVVIVCGTLYAAAFAMMVIVDHFYAMGSARAIVMGFPLPTAIMMYGVGGAPLAFVLLYVLNFDQWILTPDDFEKFEKLVRSKREQSEADA
ncbi:MAG: hypothetical protein ABGX07_21795 [Pirellulaceae bacterium]